MELSLLAFLAIVMPAKAGMTVSIQRDFFPSPRACGERCPEGRMRGGFLPFGRKFSPSPGAFAPPSPRWSGARGMGSRRTSSSITTGTWSEGFSQPRTCLSILQMAQAYSPVFDMLSNGLPVSCRLDDGEKKLRRCEFTPGFAMRIPALFFLVQSSAFGPSQRALP